MQENDPTPCPSFLHGTTSKTFAAANDTAICQLNACHIYKMPDTLAKTINNKHIDL